MGARFTLTLVAVVVLTAAFATTASAQQVSPGGPNAQVSEYVLPESEIGPIGGPGNEQNPSLGGPGPTGEVGSSGSLPFTGLWLLPLVALGITLVVVGSAAWRRRATVTPATI
jgi:hypothetical protein